MKKLKTPKESAVFDYIGHNGSFDDFATLIKESDEVRLLLRELLLILRDDQPISRYVELIPLELFS